MATISSTLSIIDNMTSTLQKITGEVGKLKDSLKGVGDSQGELDKFSFSTFLSNAEEAGKRITEIGRGMTLALTAPLVMLGKKMYDNATDYEAAYVGMTKTVDGTEEQYERLKELALELSEITPMDYTELMGIAQTGGNLGVQIDEMEAFLRGYSALQYATDQHIAGESGAQLVADFLNITEGGVANIEQFGSSIVHLGNNFNATEDQILMMGKRMAAAAHLAGFTTPEILGMATAFRAVGINAEAGGSSASKLIKQLQLSAEVGGKAQQQLAGLGAKYDFDSAVVWSNYWDAMKKDDKYYVANQLGMTMDAVQNMTDSWVLLEQFADVSGKTSDQFIKDWSTAPAQAMSDFFTGLSKLGDDGAESILATLGKMGLTEIRESNLIAAMASRPELFANAISEAVAAYIGNEAMMEEFNKQMGTQESQNAMLGNKMQNTMADLGQNLVEAIQPALDKVNELLDKFNSLSEADQDKIITAFLIFAAGGPIVTALGATITALADIGKGVNFIITNAPSWGAALEAFFTNPVFWGVAAGAAILLLIGYLDSIPSKLEEIRKGATEIPITVDDASYNETMSKIAEVQAALNGLKAGETIEEYENTSLAVGFGFGTNEMFGTALAYEAAKENAEINEIASDYAVKMNEAQAKIATAAASGNKEAAAAARLEYDTLKAEMNREMAESRANYSQQISTLFNGMASQYPEEAAKLERAVQQYDLMRNLLGAQNFDWDGYINEEAAESAWDTTMRGIYEKAFDLGYMDKSGFTKEQFMNLYDAGGINNAAWLMDLQESVEGGLADTLKTISENPILSTWLKSIVENPELTENLDFTNLEGAFDGLVKALDYQNALKQAMENDGDFSSIGEYLVLGIADGVSQNSELVQPPFYEVRDAAVAAMMEAFLIGSPSIVMMELARWLDEGIALGIITGMPVVINAITVLCMTTLNVARSILNSGAGFAIGYDFSMGIAAGIAAGEGAVAAAAAAVVSAALAAANAAAKIHSPSKETYWSATMMIKGYVEGLDDGKYQVADAAARVISYSEKAWNNAAWSDIGYFAALEQEQLLSDAKDAVKISDSDIKKIRQLAEREVINKFTTAEVHVDFTANNQISSDLDLDGVVDYLENRVAERLEAVAEGVYS